MNNITLFDKLKIKLKGVVVMSVKVDRKNKKTIYSRCNYRAEEYIVFLSISNLQIKNYSDNSSHLS